jgi:geranylgeranyl reductase family protein
MDRFDVAVVGAGPAGSRAAWRLARGGARVALIDASHPREKPCGGGVTGRALAIVADSLAAGPVTGVLVQSATFEHLGQRVRMRLDAAGQPPLRVIRRRDFDATLRDAATAAGAVPILSRTTGLRREGNRWVIATRDGEVAATWAIGADGATSLVRRSILRPFDRGDLSVATGYYVHGVSSSDVAIAFEDSPPGYLWAFPRPDHLAVGVCAQADASSPATLLPLVKRWIDRHVDGGGRELERYSWPIPSLSAASLARLQVGGSGCLLVGDAAGLVDPITREGIFFALQSAEAAADALLVTGGDPVRAFDRRVREEITPELLRAARVKARFFAPHFIQLLLDALDRSAGIRGVMADLIAGRQTYRGLRRHLLATGEFRLMAKLFGRSLLHRRVDPTPGTRS